MQRLADEVSFNYQTRRIRDLPGELSTDFLEVPDAIFSREKLEEFVGWRKIIRRSDELGHETRLNVVRETPESRVNLIFMTNGEASRRRRGENQSGCFDEESRNRYRKTVKPSTINRCAVPIFRCRNNSVRGRRQRGIK